jgi:hypothetical protein
MIRESCSPLSAAVTLNDHPTMATAVWKITVSHLTHPNSPAHTSHENRSSWPPNMSTEYIKNRNNPHLTTTPTPAPTPLPATTTTTTTTTTTGRSVTLLSSCLVLPAPRGPSPTSTATRLVSVSPSQQRQAGHRLGSPSRSMSPATEQVPSPLNSRQRRYSAAIEDPQSIGARVNRKRSLVRPERERIEPGHRQYHYRNHAAQLDEHGTRNVMPSSTHSFSNLNVLYYAHYHHPPATGNQPNQPQLRRGKSLLARDQDVAESGLSIFKRGPTLRRRPSSANAVPPQQQREKPKRGFWDHIGPGPKDAWMIYCWILTCCVPPFLLSAFGTSSNPSTPPSPTLRALPAGSHHRTLSLRCVAVSGLRQLHRTCTCPSAA